MRYSPIKIPSRTQKSAEIYIDRFLGCDFRTGGLFDNIRRSPDAANMDFGGELHTPVKRTGYTDALGHALEKPINGLHRLERHGVEYRLVHANDKLYLLLNNNIPQLIYSDMANTPSASFTINNTLYLLDGKALLVFNGSTAVRASDSAYVPLTSIDDKPNEQPNKLTAKRRNILYGTGAKYYYLDCTKIDSAPVTAYVNGVPVTEGQALTVERTLGALAFAASPTGNAEIEVHFSKTIPGSTDEINKCRNASFSRKDTKATLTGNPDKPDTAYQSAEFNPLYFPENSTVLAALNTGFPTAECAAPRSLCTLGDELLFLSRRGVCAVTPSLYNSYYYIQNRSTYINNKLTAEKNLENALSVVIMDKLYLFVNGTVYVADARLRQKSGRDGIQYEWHRWTDIPATAAVSWSGQLYFGTADGNVYRFMNSAADGDDIYSDLGKPVSAYWTTPFLGTPVTGGGSWGRKKSMPRAEIVFQPYMRSSADIFITKENETEKLLGSISLSLADLKTVDFNSFSFHSIKRPRTINFKNIARRFESLQFLIKNDRPEGLGLVAIQVQISNGAEMKGE